MEELYAILKGLHPEVDFETEDALMDRDILDSVDTVTLVMQIRKKFGVRIPPEEMVPENFNSAKAIFDLIESLEEA